MPKTSAGILLAGMTVFFACTGEPPKIIIRPEPPGPVSQPREGQVILDYQDSAGGGTVPAWVIRFLARSNQGVEELEYYEDSYVFVAANEGTNFKALGHWAQGFTVAQDFPRLAAVRIEERLLRTAVLYPDDEYGEFFETLVKKASDMVYTGAMKADTFWIKQTASEGNSPGRERYVFFVLVTIDKTGFQTQIQALLAAIPSVTPPTREQAASINRLKETFFEDF
jgi:hypothetical protein